MSELQQQYGRAPVKIFQDVAAIPPGAQWRREIQHALDRSTFMVPIITPAFVESEFCCDEVRIFLAREARLNEAHPELEGRRRIFPILYMAVGEAELCDRALFEQLHELQWIDFRSLRFKTTQDEVVQTVIASLATSLCALLHIRVVGEGLVDSSGIRKAPPGIVTPPDPDRETTEGDGRGAPEDASPPEPRPEPTPVPPRKEETAPDPDDVVDPKALVDPIVEVEPIPKVDPIPPRPPRRRALIAIGLGIGAVLLLILIFASSGGKPAHDAEQDVSGSATSGNQAQVATNEATPTDNQSAPGTVLPAVTPLPAPAALLPAGRQFATNPTQMKLTPAAAKSLASIDNGAVATMLSETRQIESAARQAAGLAQKAAADADSAEKDALAHKDGFGELSSTSLGYRYLGSVEDGVESGYGIERWTNGDVIRGHFVSNDASGPGVEQYASGDVYYGMFKKGSPTGAGVRIFKAGTQSFGKWTGGEGDGPMIDRFTDKTLYRGYYRHDKKSGIGFSVDANDQVTSIGSYDPTADSN